MSEALKKTTYHVLDPDAVFVAGERVSDTRTVALFESAARYPLLSGQISAEKPKVPARAEAAKALEG